MFFFSQTAATKLTCYRCPPLGGMLKADGTFLIEYEMVPQSRQKKTRPELSSAFFSDSQKCFIPQLLSLCAFMTFGNDDCIHSDNQFFFAFLINKPHSMPFYYQTFIYTVLNRFPITILQVNHLCADWKTIAPGRGQRKAAAPPTPLQSPGMTCRHDRFEHVECCERAN